MAVAIANSYGIFPDLLIKRSHTSKNEYHDKELSKNRLEK